MEIKKHSLLRSTSIVSLMTLISRIMGFARDMILALLFGATAGMDAFLVAFRIPNFMRRLFAEGAFSQAFVPVLSEYQKVREEHEVRRFLSKVSGSLAGALLVVTWVGMMATPLIVYVFAPGFDGDDGRFALATTMLRITMPYLMLVSMTAMYGAILNTYGYFAAPSFTPVLLNLSMISAALFLAPKLHVPIEALAWGVLAAGVLQFFFLMPFLAKRKLLVWPTLDFRDEGVRRVLKLMVPALFGVSIAQLNLMIDTIFASFLQVGSVSWLYYTDRLTDFPIGIFGASIATVVLPHLSRQHASANHDEYRKAIDWGLRLVMLLGVPSAIALTLFSMPMIAGCFAYGHFGVKDVLMTQRSLIALGLGVPAFVMVKVLASAFYSRQDIKTPVKIGAYAMIANSLLCAALIFPLQHAGLAAASAIAGYLNCGVLFYKLYKPQHYRPMAGWGKFGLQILIANAGLALYLYMMKGEVEVWLSYSIGPRLGILLGELLIGALLYFALLYLSGLNLKTFRGLTNNG